MHPLDSQVYVGEANDVLAETNVFVSDEVTGGSDLVASLEQEIGDASIGVAVFPDTALLVGDPRDILFALKEANPQYDTIVVAVGDDLVAGSDALASGEALRIANEAEGATDSTDAALTQAVQQITEALPEGPASGGGDAGIGIAVAVGVAVLIAGGATAFGVVRARRRSSAHPLPETVRGTVARLRQLTGEYSAAAARGTAQAGAVAEEIDGIATNASELFERLGRRGDEGQRATAAVEYGDTLRKLTAALDREYLLDILTHPNLWDDPADRVREVRDSLAAVSAQLVENIKQVNARRGLHFQVSLDGLIGGRKELQEWERAFEQAEGERPEAG